MTEVLLSEAQLQALSNYQHLYVAFSGGLDSTALLHALMIEPALAHKVIAVHVHHGLSPHADAWLAHCQAFCLSFSTPIHVHRVTFASRANIEAQARTARYAFFASLLESTDCMLVGHHQYDQAETVLLQLLRGAGIDGIAAMPKEKPLGLGVLIRPLLDQPRSHLETYAHSHALTWVEDESNEDTAFSRNYLRHRILPLLEARWPNAQTAISRTALHCQAARSQLDALAMIDYPGLVDVSPLNPLSLTTLRGMPEDRRENVLRVWLRKNNASLPSTHQLAQLIRDVVDASEDANPVFEWGAHLIRRHHDALYIMQQQQDDKTAYTTQPWTDFPLEYSSGSYRIRATTALKGLYVPPGSRVSIQFRVGGERFRWHGQTKSLKKLFQDWGIPVWERTRIPLIYVNDVLSMVVGYAISDHRYGVDGVHTYCIELITPVSMVMLQEH